MRRNNVSFCSLFPCWQLFVCCFYSMEWPVKALPSLCSIIITCILALLCNIRMEFRSLSFFYSCCFRLIRLVTFIVGITIFAHTTKAWNICGLNQHRYNEQSNSYRGLKITWPVINTPYRNWRWPTIESHLFVRFSFLLM